MSKKVHFFGHAITWKAYDSKLIGFKLMELLRGERDVMKKALIVTTISGFVPQFEMNNVRILQELGYEVHYASNFKIPHYGSDNRRLEGTGIVCHQVDFVRSPFRILRNVKAYHQLCHLMMETTFSLIHCHTPMGGALGRLAAEKVRRGKIKGYVKAKRQGKEAPWQQKQREGADDRKPARIIYTAHGFHFYKGAPLVNWLLYFPAEWILARWTDVLVTINREDYRRAKKLGAKKVAYVPGIGLDTAKFHPQERTRAKKREELGVEDGDFLLLSVGELSKRKNHEVVIRALAKLKALPGYAEIQYLICGQGPQEARLRHLADTLEVAEHVHFIGYREDITELCGCSDLFLFMSLQEGLPVALMEAMACGLPAICSRIRGNVDLIKDGASGCIAENTPDGVADAIKRLLWKEEERKKYSEAARKQVQCYNLGRTLPKMKRIYLEASGDRGESTR